MATIYDWSIISMECYASHEEYSNVVFNVKWKLIANDGSNKSAIAGSQDILFNSSDVFVQYNDLTENQVIDWVQNTLGNDKIKSIIDSLDAHLADLASPKVISPVLPWL